jgi:hypothetical protein
MSLNKGGRLEGKVVMASKVDFTVEVSGQGHEHHGKKLTFPIALWQGPGAVVGEDRDVEPYDKDDPRSTPRGGERVIVDFDLLDREDETAAPNPAEQHAASAASSAAQAVQAAERAEAAAKAAAASASKPSGN